MKKHFTKVLSLFLLLSVLFTMVSCDGRVDDPINDMPSIQAPSDSPADSPADPPADPPVVTFVPSEQYHLYSADFYRDCREIVSASQTLTTAFQQVYGVSCSTSAPSVGDGSYYEILVGDTGRPESKALLCDLRINDYAYRVVSENLIVICGGSLVATEAAVNKFCADVLGYTAAAAQKNTPIEVGATYTYRDTYEYERVEVNGLLLQELTLAVSNGADLSFAQPLISAIGRYTGEHINVLTYDRLTGEERGVFCIGAANRTGDKLPEVDYGAYKITIAPADGGFTICMDASSELYRVQAMEELLEKIDIAPAQKNVQITLSDGILVDFDFSSSIPQWVLKTTIEQQIADGVKYISCYYTDDEELPYRVHILEIDPAKASFYMGSTYDNYLYTPSTLQNLKGHMHAAITNGVAVVGGVNADFFDMGGDNHPKGLTIKEGQLISRGLDNRPYIGFTYDGEVVIEADPSTYVNYNLRTAVGGSHIIVKNGMPYDFGGSDDFSVTAHPRTLAGVRADGKILLVVVDGRQAAVSNGAPLKRCAQLMVELGAVSAINLDGGGSSTLNVVEDGSIITKNSPSGGSLRRVYNSLLVVSKSTEES